ncbi:MAG: NADH-quinone oxidoreductase subunit N [Bacteroidetes bacterium]|nr:NADH-quinone oxidoreductase subunit N [Bacteroidota bacterium]
MNTLIILSAVGVLALFSEMLNFKKALGAIILLGLVGAFAADVMAWNTNRHYYNEMMVVDNFSVAFTGLLIVITFLWFIMSPDFFREPSSRIDHFALIIFALIGGQLMTSYNNMLMLFLGIEILSIPMFILAGSNKSDLKSNEAALKYFLMAAFATGFLLFGMALIYGATGSFQIQNITQFIKSQQGNIPVMLVAGILMMLVGLAFKVSAAPFHFWTPDVYTGSPTVITAFMSTVVKTAAFAGFFRLFSMCFESSSATWANTIWALSALTIIIGNVTAVYQTSFKRMLAYSSISHAGYMLMAILALNQYAQGSILFYATAYSISSITAFAVLLLVSHLAGNDSIESFNGLAKKNPLLAFATVLAMLSLAGIPPLAGFFAKYYIFTAALQQHYTGLVIIAVMGSLIGVYYYFRIIIALFKSENDDVVIPVNNTFKVFLVVTSVAALLLGIMPQLVAGIL